MGSGVITGSRVTARAAIHVEADGQGGTTLRRLRSDGPLALRPTAGAVYLVGAAAGPLGGDRLMLEVEVGPHATLVVRSAAATLVLPGRGGAASESAVSARVGEGGRLVFAPEPVIAVAGCRHRARAEITVAAGGTLVWREQIVLGRHAEPSGRYASRLDVETAGVPLLRHELHLGEPDITASPAVLGGAKVVGSTVLTDPSLGAPAPFAADGLAVLPLAGPGVLVSALARDAVELRRRLRRGERLAGLGADLLPP